MHRDADRLVNWHNFADTTDMAVEEQEVIVGIVTDIDLLQYISRAEQGSGSGTESPIDKSDNPQS